MKTIAVVPMKRNNRRLPQKNTKPFTNGKPLCRYILSTLLNVGEIDEVYAYCSSPDIRPYLPQGVRFLQRSTALDRDETTMNEVLRCFAAQWDADIYVLSHATATFVTEQSIRAGLAAVKDGSHDSAFAVTRLQNFLWRDGSPLNYDLTAIPRTQDLPALYEETSGFYIFRKEVLTGLGRRIGRQPFMVEVGKIEACDIDGPEDFLIADAIFNLLYAGN